MRNIIIDALAGHQADYIEAHFEESEHTQFTYHGEKLEEVNRVRSCGGNVRALIKGGWGFVSFNDTNRLREKVSQAINEARLTNGEGLLSLHPSVVVDNVSSQETKEADNITLQEKKQLLRSVVILYV